MPPCESGAWRLGCANNAQEERWGRLLRDAEGRNGAFVRFTGTLGLAAGTFVLGTGFYEAANSSAARPLGAISALSIIDGLMMMVSGAAVWGIDPGDGYRRTDASAARRLFLDRSARHGRDMAFPATFLGAFGLAHILAGVLMLAMPMQGDPIEMQARQLGAISMLVTGAFYGSVVLTTAIQGAADAGTAEALRE